MESLKYVTILLLVCGILQAYSYLQSDVQEEASSLEADDKLVDKMIVADYKEEFDKYFEEMDREMYIPGKRALYQDTARIKRDKPGGFKKSNKPKKDAELARLAQRGRNADADAQRYQDLVRQFHTIIDGYINQGANLSVAIHLFNRHYSGLAEQLVPQRRN